MKKLLIATILGLCLLVLLGDYVCDKGRPKGYASYKGGNNKKPDHYADRKPKNDRNGHGNGSTWRNTNKNTASKPGGHHDNQIAQNNSRGNGSGHFGRR